MKKNVLITGTSTGLGLETSIPFAQNGYKVFATMRNLDKSDLIKKRIEAEGAEKSYQTPNEVAAVILKVVEAEHTPLRVRTSEWAENFCNIKTQADPDGTILLNAVIKRFL